MITNTVKKRLNGKEYGFFLGTESVAKYGLETNRPINEFFQDIQSPGGNHYLAVLISVCINSYNRKNDINERVSVEGVYDLIDATSESEWVELLKALFTVPEVASADKGEEK
jgi:predicted peroxiredoxin